MQWRSVVPVAVISAVLGCAASVGVVSLFDLGGGHTSTKTVIQQAPLQGQVASGDGKSGLTPREIYKRDAPGVVFIRAQVVERSASPFDFGFPQEQRGEATGSGFVTDKDGTILTNAHVVAGASRVTVQFADKRVREAKILGRDESTDLAVLRVDAPAGELTPLALGSSATLQVGDPTIAIGNPFGLERTLTTGVVSATKRTIRAPDGFQIDGVIQTDAAINPGNSGGPLLDATGRVIGINSQIETGGSGNGNVGIGFAIPSNTVRDVIPRLERGETIQRAYLGVSTTDSSTPGAVVGSTTPGSPAAQAGIRAGGVIVAVGGTTVQTPDDVAAAIQDRRPGERVTVEVRRDGQTQTL